MPSPTVTVRPIVEASDVGETSEPYPKIHVVERVVT
jgi:hypothetical protein